MASYIARRKFLATLLGGAAAWPLVARAQQPAMPVQQASQGHGSPRLAGFGKGLNEIYPTIVLLTSWKAVSSRSRRWRKGDESICVASRWDAAPDDDTI